MGRQHCKSTFDNIKNNIAPPEPSDSTTARPEYPNVEKAEEKTLKIIL